MVATQVSVTDCKVHDQPLSLSSHLTTARLLCCSGNGHGPDLRVLTLILDRAPRNTCKTVVLGVGGEESLLYE